MKLSESAALTLFANHGLAHPKFIVTYASGLARLPKGDHFVLKANGAVGGKKKLGLVEIAKRTEVGKKVKELLGKSTPQLPFDSILVQEFVPHDKEYYLALKAVREGVEIYFSELGGIEIESHWEKVRKLVITTDELMETGYSEEKLADLIPNSFIQDFTKDALLFFTAEDATYLEINPIVVTKDYQAIPLGVVLVLDEAAKFRHPNWPSESVSGTKSPREKRVAEIDAQIKGSIKLVEVPGGGDTAILPGGAGAALFLCDAIVKNGLKLANYAEFSGNPPDFAVAELTRQVCALPGIKNLVIGSGIANFTSVVGNVRGIIEGFKSSPQAKKLNIVIRRCGPGEDEAIELMKSFVKESGMKIQVFGRETGMTTIVAKLND